MGKFGTIWKRASVKIAYIVSAVLIVLMVTAALVATQNSFLYETLKMALGSERLVSVNMEYYASDYADEADPKAAAYNAALDFNERMAGEGIVLLKNESDSLPLDRGARVTVFGKNSVDPVIGGSGSSGSAASEISTVYTSLTDAGFTYNDVMKAFYDDDGRSGTGRGTNPDMNAATIPGFSTGETPLPYPDSVRSSYGDFDDAAIVVISRIGGEGFDLPRTMKTSFDGNTAVGGAGSPDDHYLELDANEKAMLQEACDSFENVVLVLNTSSSMELGFLDTPVFEDEATGRSYDFTNVRSALFVGLPGENGFDALGSILCGDVTPSGHLTDTYARDFTADPSWANFGNNLTADGNRYTVNGEAQNAYFVEYEEGIYVGYRYYETRAASYAGPVTAIGEETYAGGEEWYDAHVVYPFGYGMSYTDFEWDVTPSLASGSTLSADGTLSFEVAVDNIGDYAGKDVVQLYYSAPYTSGGIEKAHVVLGAFAKTDTLTTEGDVSSGTVTLTLDVRDMASYDYGNDNGNGSSVYELDPGTYTIYIARDAHGWAEGAESFTYTVPGDGFVYAEDEATGTEIANRFDDVSAHIDTYLSRADWAGTFPTMPDSDDRAVSSELISSMSYRYGDSASDPWYTETMPTQAATELTEDEATVKFIDLVPGRADGDLSVDYDDEELWDSLLNQLTVTQMARFVGVGNYQTTALLNIGKPRSLDPDGPSGYTIFAEMTPTPSVYGTATYAGETLLACTWNVDLAEEVGRCIGNEGVLGNVRGDGTPYSGWYAPACNIHRSPFGGRNWEYYSEDGFLSGRFAASVVLGAKEKGVYCYVKHFAVNEQEANRDSNGLVTWVNEQAMREIYFVPFEATVKDGGTTAMMSSFNRIGTTWAGGSYELLTEILRNEWGFRGTVVTDYGVGKAYMSTDQMLRAGGDLKLNQAGYPDHYETATDVAVIRQATKNILYTTANSCLINVATDFSYRNPLWVNIMIIVVSCVSAALIAWCVVVTVLAVKKRQS